MSHVLATVLTATAGFAEFATLVRSLAVMAVCALCAFSLFAIRIVQRSISPLAPADAKRSKAISAMHILAAAFKTPTAN